MTELLADAKAAVAREHTAPDKLRRFIQLHLALVERNPDLASVLIVELRQSAQFLKAADRAKLAAYVDLIAEVVRAGQESGGAGGRRRPGGGEEGHLRSAGRAGPGMAALEPADELEEDGGGSRY